MSAGACAVIIVTSQATAASTEMGTFAERGLLTDEQETEVQKSTEKYLKELNKIAKEIPG